MCDIAPIPGSCGLIVPLNTAKGVAKSHDVLPQLPHNPSDPGVTAIAKLCGVQVCATVSVTQNVHVHDPESPKSFAELSEKLQTP